MHTGKALLMGTVITTSVVVGSFISAYYVEKERQRAIDNSPQIQQMIEEIAATQKHDLLVNEYQDNDGKDRIQVLVVYQNGRSYVQTIEYVGQPGGDFNAIKRSFDDLAFVVDKVVKPDDPEYPTYAAMFVQQ